MKHKQQIKCFLKRAINPKNRIETLIVSSLIVFTILVVITIFKLYQIDVIHFGYLDLQNSGFIGDFIGGVFGTLISFVTIIALYMNYKAQEAQFIKLSNDQKSQHDSSLSSQISLHDDALMKQRQQHYELLQASYMELNMNSLDTKFFQLFNLMENCIDNIHITDNSASPGYSEFNGRKALIYAHDQLYARKFLADKGQHKITFEAFRRLTQNQFDLYVGVLFSMYKLVKESDYDNKFYIDLLKSALTEEELILINLYFLSNKINHALTLQFINDGFFEYAKHRPTFPFIGFN